MQNILIGVCPDLLKNSYCCMINGKIAELSTLSFFQMIEKIKHCADAANLTNGSIVVYIEEINHYAEILEQAMKFYAIPYQLIKPTTAKWDAPLFKQITGLTERTNQEERDALKLIYGLPAGIIF